MLFVSKDFKDVYGDLSEEYKDLCEKHEVVTKSFNDHNDTEDMLDTIKNAVTFLRTNEDFATSAHRKKMMKDTKENIAEKRQELKRLSKYIAQVEEIASQVAAFPHRLVAERTFFDVVNLFTLCLSGFA